MLLYPIPGLMGSVPLQTLHQMSVFGIFC